MRESSDFVQKHPWAATIAMLWMAAAAAQAQNGALQFSKRSYSVSEGSASVSISVIRQGGSAGTVTVDFYTENQTAMANEDYVPTNGTLTFLPGKTTATFSVALIRDTVEEPDEALILNLYNPTGGATLGVDTVQLTIEDDDVCSYRLTPTSRTHGPEAGVSNIAVTATAGCQWTATKNVNWIGIFPDSGTGNGEIGYSFDANTNTTSRTGRITVRGRTFTITQTGVPPPDRTKPVVSFLTPSAGARLTNVTEVIVTGRATDARGVALVEFRLENPAGTNGYGAATLAMDGAWTATVGGLIPGPNTVRVRARDTSELLSDEVTRTFNAVAASEILLATSGEGTVKPVLNGILLEVGRNYTITATPRPRNLFAGWSGDVTSALTRLVFQMRTNLILQANFVTNPFIATRGSYYGLFSEDSAVRHESAGSFVATTTDAGRFTAKMLVAGRSVSFSGSLALDGRWTNTLVRAGFNPLTIRLGLDVENGTDQITGVVGDGNWTANLVADRGGRPGATNFNGKYTVVFPGSSDPTNAPGGDSFGTVSISKGVVTFSGTLADGTAIRQKVPLSRDGAWPFYAPLHKGRGSVFSRVTFAPVGADDLHGDWYWFKPAVPGARYYTNQFTIESDANGARYQPPTGPTDLLLDFPTGGVAAFSGGNLAEPFTHELMLIDGNKVPAADGFSLKFTTANGRFSGRAAVPGTTASLAFKGVVHRIGNYGAGYFLGPTQSGQVRLQTAP